jgi:hypothetical protein
VASIVTFLLIMLPLISTVKVLQQKKSAAV